MHDFNGTIQVRASSQLFRNFPQQNPRGAPVGWNGVIPGSGMFVQRIEEPVNDGLDSAIEGTIGSFVIHKGMGHRTI